MQTLIALSLSRAALDGGGPAETFQRFAVEIGRFSEAGLIPLPPLLLFTLKEMNMDSINGQIRFKFHRIHNHRSSPSSRLCIFLLILFYFTSVCQ